MTAKPRASPPGGGTATPLPSLPGALAAWDRPELRAGDGTALPVSPTPHSSCLGHHKWCPARGSWAGALLHPSVRGCPSPQRPQGLAPGVSPDYPKLCKAKWASAAPLSPSVLPRVLSRAPAAAGLAAAAREHNCPVLLPLIARPGCAEDGAQRIRPAHPKSVPGSSQICLWLIPAQPEASGVCQRCSDPKGAARTG